MILTQPPVFFSGLKTLNLIGIKWCIHVNADLVPLSGASGYHTNDGNK